MDMSVWYLMGAALVFFMQCGFAIGRSRLYKSKKCGQHYDEKLNGFLYWDMYIYF